MADKHRKSGNDEITIAPIIKFGKFQRGGESNIEVIQPNISGESSESSANTESPSIADTESLNELPTEINVALNAIDLPSESVDEVSAFPQKFVVNARILRIRAEPNTDSAVIKLFKEGAVINISAISGKWAELERGGWAYLPLLKEHK